MPGLARPEGEEGGSSSPSSYRRGNRGVRARRGLRTGAPVGPDLNVLPCPEELLTPHLLQPELLPLSTPAPAHPQSWIL